MVFSQAVVFFLLAASVSAFTPTFKYGCNSTHCQYQFVVSEDVAAYVDPYVLQSDISQLNVTVGQVLISSGQLNDDTLANFTKTFNETYDATSPDIITAINNANASADVYDGANDTSFSLQQNSFNIALLAVCLSQNPKDDVGTANCLATAQANAPFDLSIETVFLPTTVAPPTTVAQTTPGSTVVPLDGTTGSSDGSM